MESSVILKAAISFVVAGFWIAGATLLAERLGSRGGGLIANLPSNILVSMLFVALSQSVSFASEATRAVPIGMAIDTVFLFIMIVTLRHGLLVSVLLSTAGWFLLAFTAGKYQYSGWIINIAIYIIIVILSFLVLEYLLRIASAERIKRSYNMRQVLFRAWFAGSIVAGTVIISELASPFWTGLFATFPAVLLSTMVILTINQSVDFARAAGKILIFSSSNIVIYAVAIHYLYPTAGLILGTLLAFAAALLWILIFRPAVKKLS